MNEKTILPENGEPTRPTRVWKEAEGSLTENRDGKTVKAWATKTGKPAALNPAYPRVPIDLRLKQFIYDEVKQALDQDPFLAYEDETEAAYRVHNHAKEALIVPKERAVPEPFPVHRPPLIRKAYRFLLLAAVGLVLSGLGAIIFAPAAGLYALRSFAEPLQRADQVRGGVIFGLSVAVFLVGAALAYLFWLHLVG